MKKHVVTLSPTLRRLLLELQTYCSADCCKERAFELSVDSILCWLEGEKFDRTVELLHEINTIHRAVQVAHSDVSLDSRDLYSSWDFMAFYLFWAEFATKYEAAVKKYRQ